MRKFKVTKRWPGGPEVGTTLSNYDVYANFYSAYGSVERSWHIDELTEEYTKEIKEPEEFWVMDTSGNILSSRAFQWLNNVPNWNRFRTKHSAEKFANALKDTHGRKINLSMQEECSEGQYGLFSTVDIHSALNDRVK